MNESEKKQAEDIIAEFVRLVGDFEYELTCLKVENDSMGLARTLSVKFKTGERLSLILMLPAPRS